MKPTLIFKVIKIFLTALKYHELSIKALVKKEVKKNFYGSTLTDSISFAEGNFSFPFSTCFNY